MRRKANVSWKKSWDVPTGKGKSTTPESQALVDVPFSLDSCYGTASDTNPAELLAASHSESFTADLVNRLIAGNYSPDDLAVECEITYAEVNNLWTVTNSDITLNATVPNITLADLTTLANQALSGCMISRLINCQMTVSVSLT
jgi:osmotically inducible protein OsmC